VRDGFDRYNRYSSAHLGRPLRVTDEVTEIVQYYLRRGSMIVILTSRTENHPIGVYKDNSWLALFNLFDRESHVVRECYELQLCPNALSTIYMHCIFIFPSTYIPAHP